MNHNIHPNLADLAIEVDKLVPLPGNPRVGNVDAIMASYNEFGQVKPIVVKQQDDGTYVVIAGNHQLQAVKRLGWSHIAAVQMDGDDEHAVAFALVDNRVADLGKTDPELLHSALTDVVDAFPELFDAVGWDEYEVASMATDLEEFISPVAANGTTGGYIPPVLQNFDSGESVTTPAAVVRNDDGDSKYTAPTGIDQRQAVVGGSTTTGQAGTKQAVFSFNLVFDDADQMSRWWDFVRWLRANHIYDGSTIAEKLMSFIDHHSEV